MRARSGFGTFFLVATFLFSCPAAQATSIAITPGDGWHAFDVDDLTSQSFGLEWIDFSDGSPLAFTFTLAQAAKLTVVDAAFAGDAFQIFDNGASIGFTPIVQSSYPVSNGLDFDGSLANPDYSHAVFSLLAGTHVISGLLSTSIVVDGAPLNATVGALRLDLDSLSEVPLPATLPLFATGLAAFAFLGRRKKVNAADPGSVSPRHR